MQNYESTRIPQNNYSRGFTLVEILIGITLFIIIGLAIFSSFSNILDTLTRNQWRADAISAIQNEIEVIRGMKFEDIGILGGFPAGKILAEKNVVFGDNSYLLKTTVRSIDDPYDGTLGGNPNDTAPADYKMVEIEAQCKSCINADAVYLTTTIAPKGGLETTTKNGALFINVFDASGQPVANVDVNVTNASTTPQINISDQTNNDGVLQLVDVPTSTMSYAVAVSKGGYSAEQTYPMGAVGNPNPVKPHATVSSQQVTSISFAIDQISSINLTTKDVMCDLKPSVDFSIEGTKLIGTNPDVLKYSADYSTDVSGAKNLTNLEWDTYKFFIIDSLYDLIGSSPLLSLNLSPATSTDLVIYVGDRNPSSLLITVTDQNSQPINDASVKLEKTGYQETFLTGRKRFSQTDWSTNNYSSQSGSIDSETTAGQITLLQSGGAYPTSTEWIISNSFNLGTSQTNFYKINWEPLSQPLASELKFQLAANNDNSTWNFIGPDGTAGTYYANSGDSINSALNGNRYFRYKAFLSTTNENLTPSLENIYFDFSSACVPSGQAIFTGLSTGIYTITVEKSGYQTFADTNVSVASNWQEYKTQLTP